MSRPGHPRFVSRLALGDARIVFDPQTQMRWTVQEVIDRRAADDEHDGRWLLFSCDHATRRIRTYPTGWTQLPDGLLLRLAFRN